jgi:RNA exonuclease 4
VKDRVVVGHAVKNDVRVFPSWVFVDVQLRDTQMLEEYREHSKCAVQRMPKLAVLARVYLKREIQGEEHSSVEDAHVTMELFRLREGEIERTQVVEVVVELRDCMRLFDEWVRDGSVRARLHKSEEYYRKMAEIAPSNLKRLVAFLKPEVKHLLFPESSIEGRAMTVHHGATSFPTEDETEALP